MNGASQQTMIVAHQLRPKKKLRDLSCELRVEKINLLRQLQTTNYKLQTSMGVFGFDSIDL